MISESSPSLLFEACHPDQVTLIRQVWDAAHAHGVKMTEQAHAWLDEPEFVLTECLRVPVERDYIPVKNAKDILEETRQKDLRPLYRSKFAYHIKLAEGFIKKSTNLRQIHSGKY